MPIPPSLADRSGALLTIAARTGQELAGKRLAPMGLTVRLCGVLNLLGNGPISQQELGEQLGFFGALKPSERQLLSDMMRRLIAAADEKLGKTPKVP